MREVLVTGSAGLIGSAVVRQLVAAGVSVTRLLRPASRVTTVAGARTVTAALDDVGALRPALAALRPSHVIHLAAYGVHPAARDGAELVRGNVAATVHLVESLADAGLERMVHVGSCAEYGTQVPVPVPDHQPLQPDGPYGAAKAAAALLGSQVAAARGVPWVTVRLFGTFGPGEGPHRLVPWLVRQLRIGARMPLTAGTQVRDFTFVEDIAGALIAACRADLPAGGAYHACSGRGTSVRDVAHRVAALVGAPDTLLDWGALPTRGDEPPVLIGDPRRFSAATGWSAATSLDDGLRAAVAHELARPRAAAGEVTDG